MKSRRTPLAIAVALLVLLAFAYGVASWQAGRLAEQHVREWVAQADTGLAEGWPAAPRAGLQIESYDRGIFTSRIRYRLQLPADADQASPLQLEDRLAHGPWPWDALRQGEWRPLAAYSHLAPQRADAAGPRWRVDSKIGFDGEIRSVATVQPFESPQTDFRFSGGRLVVHHVPHNGATTLSGTLDHLAWRDDPAGTRVALDGLDFEGRYQGSADQTTRQSHQTLRIARLSLTDPAELPTVVLEDQVLRVDSAQTGQLLDGQIDYGAGSLLLDDRPLGDLKAVLAAEHLDAPAVRALFLAWDAVTQARAQADADADTPLSAAEEQALREPLIPVLAAAPRLAVRTLRWGTPEGASAFQLTLDFQGVDDQASEGQAPEALGALIERSLHQVVAQLDVSRPMVFRVLRQSQPADSAQGVPALIGMLFDHYVGRMQRAGLVTQADDRVSVHLDYAAGRLTLNGVERSLAEVSEQLEHLWQGPF